MLISTSGKRMNASRECKLPELTEIAKFTVGSSKQHNTLQTLITRALCLQKQFISNVVKQDRRNYWSFIYRRSCLLKF